MTDHAITIVVMIKRLEICSVGSCFYLGAY